MSEQDKGRERRDAEGVGQIELRLLALRELVLNGLVEKELPSLIGACSSRVLERFQEKMNGERESDAFYGWARVQEPLSDRGAGLLASRQLARSVPISCLRRTIGGSWPVEMQLCLYQKGETLVLDTGDGDLELTQCGWRLVPGEKAKAGEINEVEKATAVIEATALLMENCDLDISGLARVEEIITQLEIGRKKLRDRIQGAVNIRARNLVRQVEDNKSSLGEYKFIRGSGAWQLVMAGTASGSVVRAWREFHQSVGSELDRPVTEDRFEGERVVIGEGHKRDPNIAMTIDKSDELLVVSFLPEGKGILVLTSNRQQFFGLDSSPLLEKALGLIDASRRFVGETIGGLAVSE